MRPGPSILRRRGPGRTDATIEDTGRHGVGTAITPLPPTAICVAVPPKRQHTGQSGQSAYQRLRPRRLLLKEREAIRVLAPIRSLRELATECGVSHETVRAIVRATPSADRHFAVSRPIAGPDRDSPMEC